MRIVRWFQRRAARRRWRAAVAAEVVVTNVQDANWVVIEVGGGTRYVKSNLFARNGDVAVAAERFQQ